MMKKSKRIISFALAVVLALCALTAAAATTDYSYPYYPYVPYYPVPYENWIPLPLNYYPNYPIYPAYGYDPYYYNGYAYTNPWAPYYGMAPGYSVVPPIGYVPPTQNLGNVAIPSPVTQMETAIINQRPLKLRIIGLNAQESDQNMAIEPNKVGTALRFTETLRRDYNGKLVLSLVMSKPTGYASAGVLVATSALDALTAAKIDKFELCGADTTFTYDVAQLRNTAREEKTDELFLEIGYVENGSKEYQSFNSDRVNATVDFTRLYANKNVERTEITNGTTYEVKLNCMKSVESVVVYSKNGEIIKVKGAYTYNDPMRISYASASVPFGVAVTAYTK